MDVANEGLMTVAEVADFLAVSRTTVWKLMTAKRLPYLKVGRSRRLPRAAVKGLITDGLVGLA